MKKILYAGIDVGSTTTKLVVTEKRTGTFCTPPIDGMRRCRAKASGTAWKPGQKVWQR